MPGRIQQTRSRERRCALCGASRVVRCIPRKFPGVHHSLQGFSPNPRKRAVPSFFFSSVWIFRMQNHIILSNSTFASLNLRKILIPEAEYFMQTSRNLRNSNRNPGTVEKSSIRKPYVAFAQKTCSEAHSQIR